LVEDEMHVLLVCPLYDVIRHSMILEAQLVIDDFIGLTLEQQFDVLLGNNNLCRITANTCCDILARRKKLIYVCV
jgi:hypothetical protein